MNKQLNYNQAGTSGPPGNQRAVAGQFKRRRNFLLALPILVWPFLAMAFWALGGGSTSEGKSLPSGLSTELPEPILKVEKEDKLSLYELAEAAEKKRKDAILSDPYFQDSSKQEPLSFDDWKRPEVLSQTLFNKPGGSTLDSLIQTDPLPAGIINDEQAQKVLQRLSQLHQTISQAPPSPKMETKPVQGSAEDPSFSNHVDRLEDMMHLVKDQGSEDPEMEKIQGVLERIVDIQHPERVHHDPVSLPLKEPTSLYTLSNTGSEAPDTGFYGGLQDVKVPGASNVIEADVQGSQLLQEGGLIKLKLGQPVFIASVKIPEGTFVYGRCHFREERLEVTISSLRFGVSIFPVKLEVYDLDGLPGISIPGELAREIAKSSGASAVQRIDMSNMDPSLKVQAAAAGIGAAKSFFSKKITRIQVRVQTGYQVLLKQN
jgi:conjugative transposon TraM protein